MPTHLLRVEITQEKQDAVTPLPENLFAEPDFLRDLSAKGRQGFVKMGRGNVDQETGCFPEQSHPGTGTGDGTARAARLIPAPGSRFSHRPRVLFPMRKVFITLVTGYSRRGGRLFMERCRIIYGEVSGYLLKCVMTFVRMQCRIYGNVPPHLLKWCDALGEMTRRIWGDVPPHLPKWSAALGEMTGRIWGNVPTYLLKWCDAFRGMTHRLYGNNPEHLPEWCDAFREMTHHLYGNNPPHLPKGCTA